MITWLTVFAIVLKMGGWLMLPWWIILAPFVATVLLLLAAEVLVP